MASDGERVDATAWHGGIGAEGGIVANAEDEAGFLRGLMRGELLRPSELADLKTTPASIGSDYALGLRGCAERVRGHRLPAWRRRCGLQDKRAHFR